MLLGPFDVGLVGVALLAMTTNLGDDVGRGQAVMVVYLATLAIAYIPVGRLGDRRLGAAAADDGQGSR